MSKVVKQFLFTSVFGIVFFGLGLLLAQKGFLNNFSRDVEGKSPQAIDRNADQQPLDMLSREVAVTSKANLSGSNQDVELVEKPGLQRSSTIQEISPRRAERELLQRARVRDDSQITVETLGDGAELIHYNGTFQHVSSASIGEDGEAHVNCDHDHEDIADLNAGAEPQTFIK